MVGSTIIIAEDFNVDVTMRNLDCCKLLNLMYSCGLILTVHLFKKEFKGSNCCIDNIFTDLPSEDLNVS